MHELSIAMSLLEVVEEQSQQRGGAHISAVHVRVGPLSGVIAQALNSAFELARESTEFKDCRLVIEETPVTVHCPTCKSDQPVESVQQMSCAVCGTATADLATGRELEVCAMEISD